MSRNAVDVLYDLQGEELSAPLSGADQQIKFKLKPAQIKEIEFHLPMVMERIVMAVQSGLDVIPALSRQVELSTVFGSDPVTQLIERVLTLTESGMGFESALQVVAEKIECAAVRHAFVHLGVAVREGGELVMPLKELSDATQAYYQESVEEDIAKLPVKATLPLLLTFAGLILCFLTAPLMQVVNIVGRAHP